MEYDPILDSEGLPDLDARDQEWARNYYNRHRATFWTENDITFIDQDHQDWNNLRENERNYLMFILAFFSQSDFIVNDNIMDNIVGYIKPIWMKMYYNFQLMMEDIHSQVYHKVMRGYIKDEELIKKLKNAVIETASIKNKITWFKKYTTIRKNRWKLDFSLNVAVSSAMEGIFFSSSFAGILWCKSRGILPALVHSNDLIRRDESLHQEFSQDHWNNLINKETKEVIIDMLKEACELEQAFVRESLPDDLIGMNQKMMCQYVEFVTDRNCYRLIGEKIYNSINPFGFIQDISLEGKTNFFEHRVSEYAEDVEGKISFDMRWISQITPPDNPVYGEIDTHGMPMPLFQEHSVQEIIAGRP